MSRIQQIHVLIVKGQGHDEMQLLINKCIGEVSIGDCLKICKYLQMDVYYREGGPTNVLIYKNKIYSLDLKNNFIVYFESNYYDSQPIKNIGDIVAFLNKNQE